MLWLVIVGVGLEILTIIIHCFIVCLEWLDSSEYSLKYDAMQDDNDYGTCVRLKFNKNNDMFYS